MKKLLILLALATIFISCDTFIGLYTVSLTEVEKPINLKEPFGESSLLKIPPTANNLGQFEDETIKINWFIHPYDLRFVLTNKTNHSIKVIWDDAVYVDADGSNQRIFHNNVKYNEKASSQSATSIVKKTSLQESIMPIQNADYVRNQSGGNWVNSPLLPVQFKTPEEFVAAKSKYVGKYIRVLLPIMVENQIVEYLFTFQISDIVRQLAITEKTGGGF